LPGSGLSREGCLDEDVATIRTLRFNIIDYLTSPSFGEARVPVPWNEVVDVKEQLSFIKKPR
jgi:hypothetical protein